MSKWLLRKTSGSRSKYKSKGDYADTRQGRNINFEDLPQRESMRNKNAHHTFLDTTLIKRWLYSKVGQDFDDVYSEYLTRIQPKYLDQYRDSIYLYVERKTNVEIKENGEVWGKYAGRKARLPHSMHSTFYVHPETNKLMKI